MILLCYQCYDQDVHGLDCLVLPRLEPGAHHLTAHRLFRKAWARFSGALTSSKLLWANLWHRQKHRLCFHRVASNGDDGFKNSPCRERPCSKDVESVEEQRAGCQARPSCGTVSPPTVDLLDPILLAMNYGKPNGS